MEAYVYSPRCMPVPLTRVTADGQVPRGPKSLVLTHSCKVEWPSSAWESRESRQGWSKVWQDRLFIAALFIVGWQAIDLPNNITRWSARRVIDAIVEIANGQNAPVVELNGHGITEVGVCSACA